MRMQHPGSRVTMQPGNFPIRLANPAAAQLKTAAVLVTVGFIMLSQSPGYAGEAKVGVTEVSRSVVVFSTTSGNVVASVGADGAFLVGTPSAQSTLEIARILANRTQSHMRYVVISPEDAAQSDGDAGWGRLGAFVSMQEKALERIGGHNMGAPTPLPRRLVDLHVDRPRLAFSEVLTADLNGEAIHVVRQPPGYSDADAIVHFHVANLVYLGEVFPGDGYPCIDKDQHGNLNGLLKTLEAWTDPETTIVPVRGHVAKGSDVKQYRAMIITVRDRVKRLMDSGKNEEQIQAEHPTAEFDAKWAGGRISPRAFVSELYAALAAK